MLADPWRKPLPRVLLEAARAAVRGRGMPRHYFKHMLYRTGAGDIDGYLTQRAIRRIQLRVRDRSRTPFLENKLLFHRHFASADVRLPRLLGYSVGSAFFSEGATHPLNSADDLRRLSEWLQSRSQSGGTFVKPISGSQGEGAFPLNPAALEPEPLAAHHAQLLSGNFLFEEAIVQHPRLSEIYPFSVNTLRIITCVRRDGSVEVASALLRLGASRSNTDNGSAGGLFLGVDLDSGSLAPYARKLRKAGGTFHSVHPDTGFRFAGSRLPHFAAALETARAAATHLPYGLVGWDIATTPDGPVLIEGNHTPHISASEVADGGYRNNPAFRAFMDDLGVT